MGLCFLGFFPSISIVEYTNMDLKCLKNENPKLSSRTLFISNYFNLFWNNLKQLSLTEAIDCKMFTLACLFKWPDVIIIIIIDLLVYKSIFEWRKENICKFIFIANICELNYRDVFGFISSHLVCFFLLLSVVFVLIFFRSNWSIYLHFIKWK